MSILFILFVLTYSSASQVDLPQSHIVLSDIGYYFAPEQTVEWLNDMFVSSLQECIHQCNQDPLCHSFDYNTVPNWCRLFEAEPSPGQINYCSPCPSQAGYVQLLPDLYSAFNQTCDQCAEERYLFCIQGACRCSWNSFWDGSVCRKQKYAGSLCADNEECRSADYNLICVLENVCTSKGYPSNMCAVNQNLVQFSYTTTAIHPYSPHSFNFTANTTSVTVTFSLKNNGAYWFLDNISMIDVSAGAQLIKNGGFETGDLTDWNYCNPNSTSNSSNVGQNSSLTAQSGQYFYFGAPYPDSDFLSQTVSTTIGTRYTFSFWLGNRNQSSSNAFMATIFA